MMKELSKKEWNSLEFEINILDDPLETKTWHMKKVKTNAKLSSKKQL